MKRYGVSVLKSLWQLPLVYLKSLPHRFLSFLTLFDFFSGKYRHGFKQPSIFGSPKISWGIFLITKSVDLLPLWFVVDLISNIVKPNKRHLNASEMERFRFFFNTVPLKSLRIDERSVLARIGKRYAGKKQLGVTVFRTIHFTRPLLANHRDLAWLCHELVHVAQMQSLGSQYILETLYAQHKEGYDYVLDRDRLSDYNLEQQADIIREIFIAVQSEGYISDRYQLFIDDLSVGRF